MGDGTNIVLRRHGNPGGPRLVVCHGNGLASDLYYPFWSLLTGECDLIVYDLRNHGWNEVTAIGNHNIPSLVKDHDLIMETIDSYFGYKPKVGAFHSVSALISLLSPTKGSAFAGRILFDAPLCRPGQTTEEMEAATARNAAAARKRRESFANWEDFSHRLRSVPALSRVVPGVFDLMAKTTLRKDPGSDHYELRCPREYEARLAEYGEIYSGMVDLGDLASPTKVLGADPSIPFSYLPSLGLTDIVTVDFDFLPDSTHLLQLEKPEACAAAVRDFLNTIHDG
ncbi:MAG: alpha/beta hydrolase [bacterium]|nr:alpha/beta hydrolase [bacterium]MDE0233762.1 alpha/beta hydrolase [bacterium]